MKKYIGLGVVTLFGALFVSSNPASATSTSATASVNVAEACTMSSTLTSPHTATIPPNTNQTDIGITTIKVTCNDASGYSIYAVGYTGNEIGGTNSTKLVGVANSTSTISTGTATSGNTSNWSMKLSTSGSSYVATLDNSFGSYHTVPAEYTKVAHYNSATDLSTGSTLTTTYAAYINGTQSADTYAGKVKYTMVHPTSEVPPHEVACSASRICYNPNTNVVQGQMGQQSASNNASVTLYASNFKRDGYGFAGWSDSYDYENDPDANLYGPNETITTPSNVSTNGLSLYAIWVPSQGSMQSDTSTVCSGLTQSGPNVDKTLYSVSALTDERDNNTYAIAKLADGKCWMIENLRLDDTPILSLSNTHNPSLPLTNVYDLGTTSNHLSPTSSVAYNATTAPEGWCTTNSSACDDQSRLRTDNITLFTNNTASGYSASSNVYGYGNYYNWYSATAGHGKYGSSYGDGYTAPGDICPAGWHLPKGGNKSYESTNDFWALIVSGLNNGINPANYDGQTQPYYTGDPEGIDMSKVIRLYPNNFIYSGYVDGGSINSRTTGGNYWTYLAGHSNSAYTLSFGSNGVYPGTGGSYKYNGRMVRCVSGV